MTIHKAVSEIRRRFTNPQEPTSRPIAKPKAHLLRPTPPSSNNSSRTTTVESHRIPLDNPTPSLCSDTDQDIRTSDGRGPSTPPIFDLTLDEEPRRRPLGAQKRPTERIAVKTLPNSYAGPSHSANPSSSRQRHSTGSALAVPRAPTPDPPPTRRNNQATSGQARTPPNRPSVFTDPSRIPISPIPPGRTSNKPKPPARARNAQSSSSSQNKRSTQHNSGDLNYDRGGARAPTRDQRMINHHENDASFSEDSSTSVTLDQELLSALDAEAEVLVGVGLRSKKRGFLGGGGAGGPPVFRGVGYVDGAEEDDLDLLSKRGRNR